MLCREAGVVKKCAQRAIPLQRRTFDGPGKLQQGSRGIMSLSLHCSRVGQADQVPASGSKARVVQAAGTRD